MNWKGTFYLIATTLGLFAFIWFFERHLGKASPPPPPGKLAPGLSPSAVTAIETVTGGVTNRVELVDNGWRLVSPVDYPAEKLFIEAFIGACAELTPHTSISKQVTGTQPEGVDDYGFNPPRARIVFRQSNDEVVIEIGNRSPSEKWVYARSEGTEGVEIVDANILRYIPTTPDGWRDRSLIRLGDAPFNQLDIAAATGGFELTRSNLTSAWRITRPKPAKRANNYRSNMLMQYILNWRIAGFVTDDPQADLTPYGLKSPAARITFRQGTNQLAVVELGGSPTNNPALVYARRWSHTNVVLVPRQLLDSVNTPFAHFRDEQLLSFDPAIARQIVVQADETFALQRQTNDAWLITRPAPAGGKTNAAAALPPALIPADPELVGRFMTNLMSLQVVSNGWVKDVVADYAPFGLAPPRRSYAIHTNAAAGLAFQPVSATNQPFAQIGIGSRPQGELATILARRMSEDSVYKISLGEVMQLPARAYELRNRQIWDFDPRLAESVTIRHAGKTRKLVRTDNAGGDRGWALDEGFQGIINVAAVEAQVLQLSQLRAINWSYQGESPQALQSRGIFDEFSHSIELVVSEPGGRKTYRVTWGKKTARGDIYAAVKLAGGTTVFEYDRGNYETIAQFLGVPLN